MIFVTGALLIILLTAVVLHAAVVLLLPIAAAGAIYFFIRLAVQNFGEDTRILDGGIGIALFILILWII